MNSSQIDVSIKIDEECIIWTGSSSAFNNCVEKIVVLESAGGRLLRLASNYPYELWLDGYFIGDGGHRCSEGEVLLDHWPEAIDAEVATVRLHWVNPEETQILSRCLFQEIFLAELSKKGSWACWFDESIQFSAKLSAQLPRQNILKASSGQGNVQEILPKVLQSNWHYLDSPIQRARYTKVNPRLIQEGTLSKQLEGDFQPEGVNNIAVYVRYERPVELTCLTYDLQKISLYRFEVIELSTPCVLYYSEVCDFDQAFSTRFREKVHLADAFARQSASASLFGTRGCRYVHVLYPSTTTTRPAIKVWRREYPLRWKTFDLGKASLKSKVIIEACKNNLIACIDGGAVDTCWRERAQWTGDLRMSALALRTLTTNSEVIDLALHQIAQSYDASTGMVNAVWPAMEPNSIFTIPQFHLAFCLTALEHDPRLKRDPIVSEVVRDSMAVWKQLYWKEGLMQGMPGWNFTDWDYSDPIATGRAEESSAPNAVCNAWWSELCEKLDPSAAVSPEVYDTAFWMKEAYALTATRERESPHATAAALNCSVGINHIQESLDYLEAENTTGGLKNRVTPYFAYFIAKAFEKNSKDRAIAFVEEFYGPIAEKYGCIYEKTSDEASLAHGWSVGIVSLLVE